MKIFLWFVLGHSALVPIINSKKYQIIIADEILDYDLGQKLPSTTTYFSLDNLILDQVADDTIIIGGYLRCIKSFDRNVPITASLRSQYFQNSKWNEGVFQIIEPDTCTSFRSTHRFWYNITKLITSDICPPQKGDIWRIENQTLNTILDLPVVPLVPWKAYIKFSQGLPGFETHIYGFGVRMEVLQV